MEEFGRSLGSLSWWISVVAVGIGINIASDGLKPVLEWLSSVTRKWLVKPATSRMQRFFSRLSKRLDEKIARLQQEANDRTMAMSISKTEQFFEMGRAMRLQQRGIHYQIQCAFFLLGAAWTKSLWQESPTNWRLFVYVTFALTGCITLISAVKATTKANARWKEIENAHTLVDRVAASIVEQIEVSGAKKGHETYGLK